MAVPGEITIRPAQERRATVALTVTYPGSALSLLFWQERMGYRTRSVNLAKPLV
jgi:hypothetical protein